MLVDALEICERESQKTERKIKVGVVIGGRRGLVGVARIVQVCRGDWGFPVGGGAGSGGGLRLSGFPGGDWAFQAV